MLKPNLSDRLWAAHVIHGTKPRTWKLIRWIETGEGGERYPKLVAYAQMRCDVRKEVEHPRSLERYVSGLPIGRRTNGLRLEGEDFENDLLKVYLLDLETWIRAGTRLRVYRKRPRKPADDGSGEMVLVTRKEVLSLIESLQMLLNDWHTEAVR